MLLTNPSIIESALSHLGEYLTSRKAQYSIVVIGGAAMNLLGFVSRETRDVDVLAIGYQPITEPSQPLPEPLENGIREVARYMNLEPRWMNTDPAPQWRLGLPPGLEDRIHWRDYGLLKVGLIDRYDLIFFKLYAAADDTSSKSVHFKDLMALKPTHEELDDAAAWTREQDPSPAFSESLDRVMAYAKQKLA